MAQPYNVLFLCTGNSARSIMAEAILNHKGRPNFAAHSAGSRPTGQIRPEALHQLAVADLPRNGLRSKSWEEFSMPSSPKIDFIFTLCDDAANETCPIWPGHPITAHWEVPDPSAATGNAEEIEHAYRDAFMILERRISLLLCLPLESLDNLAIKKHLDGIASHESSRALAAANS